MMLQPHPKLSDQRAIALLSAANIIRLPQIRQKLGAVFPRLDVVAPENLEHLAQIVRRSHNTHKLVLAVGGDGMLHHVFQSLDLDKQILGIVPSGTGNDVARALQYPKGLDAAIAYLRRLEAKSSDFGQINEYRYINSAGFGLDSHTLRVRHTHRGILRSNYLAAFIYSLATLKPIECTLVIDHEELSGRFYWVLAMNSPFIGGGTHIAPKATFDDGLLDVVLVKDTSKWTLIKSLPATVKGQHLGLDMVLYRQARTLICKTKQPIPILAVDGEERVCAQSDVTMSVRAGELQLLQP